jgi:hypothetical protein
VTTHTQLSLNFEPGLTARFKRLEDCCAHVVLGKGLENVAGPLDMAPSELSRRLSAHLEAKAGDSNNRPLRVSDFVAILEETKDYRPIFWLIERFLRDPEAQRTHAIHQLAAVMPIVQSLLEQAGVEPKLKVAR